MKDIYAALGETKVDACISMGCKYVDACSGRRNFVARIIDVEEEYERDGSQSDTWNYWLNVKGRTILWKELYELDIAARVFQGRKTKPGGRMIGRGDCEVYGKGIFLIELKTKLEAMDVRLSGIEKTHRFLKKSVKKMEMRLTSLESKGNENMNRGDYMDFEPWERMNCDREEEKAREEEKEVVEEKEAEKSVVEEEQADKDVVEDEEHAQGAVGEEEQILRKKLKKNEEIVVEAKDKTDEEADKTEQEVVLEDEKTGKEGKKTEAEAVEEGENSEEAEKTKHKNVKIEEDTVKEDEKEDEKANKLSKKLWSQRNILREEKTVGINEEKTDGINEEKRDMTKEEARLGIYLRCKKKMMIFDKPRKVTTKKRTKLSKTYTDGTPKKWDIQRKSNATMSACTPREKRKCEKSQWLQSSLTEGKTDDIDGQKKKRKTNA
ncbi:LOW QUALITY PROTEIN: hypothetical protein HID58_079833 [Brassica napus]|uniref:DUF287 domain-containing protein n=2 Tax=Brassica TaxID=3705 RepID=A0ABQ7Y356_BRANA|nr:LOW QUALITY PROTEIN: hypothetical protein HID58_079833 [Brassica napus]